MKIKVLIILGSLFVTGLILFAMLPKILNLCGLHPEFKGEQFNLQGLKVRVITTSQDDENHAKHIEVGAG